MRVHLSLGSNLGDREANLQRALSRMDSRSRCRLLGASRIYETEPVGDIEQPPFLNLAAEIETDLAPLELLTVLKETERQMGREPAARWGPRLIDIDIVLYGDRVVESDELTVPHPRFRDRAFVLQPLVEIAGHAIDPVTGATVEDLAAACQDQNWVRVYEPEESANRSSD